MSNRNRQEALQDLEKRTGSLNSYFSFLQNCGNFTIQKKQDCGGFPMIDEITVKNKMEDKGFPVIDEITVKKKKIEDEDGEEHGVLGKKSQDPLVVLGLDIMYLILSNLDATGLASCLLVSYDWNGIAISDKLWSAMCDELWRGKAHMPRIARLPGLPKLSVYSLSAMDGKRTRITRDDLCDHVWEFRFKKDAPEYWKNLDPSWDEGNENNTMLRYFHRDGSQTAGLGDRVWGGHEASYRTVTGIYADGKIRTHYVRINRYEPMSISRKNDWTWEMSNKLVQYTSIPDFDKEDGTGPIFIGF